LTPRPAVLHGARHLVLVGLPGAGKSTVGRAVADRLGRPFIDLDVEIERSTGQGIGELFATRGEAGFRALEQAATAELVGRAPAVIAPGGGWVTVPETVALLRSAAQTIYLKVDPETALRRLGRGVSKRPLLARDEAGPEEALRQLFAARRAAYEAADFVVDTEHLTRQQVTDSLVELAWEQVDY
jgi:shikimate kinase